MVADGGAYRFAHAAQTERDLESARLTCWSPNFKWFLVGGEGSGLGVHTDPHNSSAWNACIVGSKRWCLMPPSAQAALVCMGSEEEVQFIPPDQEYCAQEWFAVVYPKLRSLHISAQNKGIPEGIGLVEGVQRAGEIVVIPAGWWHLVLNLEPTVAFTENFVTAAQIGPALATMALDGDTRAVMQWCRQLPLLWCPQCFCGVLKHLFCNFADCRSTWSKVFRACSFHCQFNGPFQPHYL